VVAGEKHYLGFTESSRLGFVTKAIDNLGRRAYESKASLLNLPRERRIF